MQKIAFVIGPPAGGKSSFIRTHFPGSKVVDLFEFQNVGGRRIIGIGAVLQSYEDARDALADAAASGADVVLEHPLLLAKRRPMYLDAVKEKTDAPVDVYVLVPDEDTFSEFYWRRHKEQRPKEGERPEISPAELSGYDMLEIPKPQEGFRNIYLVRPFFADDGKTEVDYEITPAGAGEEEV